jgi:hypothetical protein
VTVYQFIFDDTFMQPRWQSGEPLPKFSMAPTSAVAQQLEQRLLLVATVRFVRDTARQEVPIGAAHDANFLKPSFYP